MFGGLFPLFGGGEWFSLFCYEERGAQKARDEEEDGSATAGDG